MTAEHSTSDSAESERPDLAAAIALMKTQAGARKEVRIIARYLDTDERVLRLASGLRSGKKGLLVLTDRRLTFLWKGLVRENHESIPLDLITAVALKRGLTTSKILTQGAQSREEINGVNKKDAEALVTDLRDLLNKRSGRGTGDAIVTVSGDGQPDRDDVFDSIKQLKELFDAGVLTEAEYEEKKAELLARL